MAIYDSMQVRASLGDTTLVALLDTGSTHNFIAEDAARRTGLPIQPRPRLTATMANGERVTCPGVIRRAPVLIDDETFFIDLFVMPLTGYDLVLGTQWMVTLGRMVWDFVNRTVSFRMVWDFVNRTVSFLHQGRTKADRYPGRTLLVARQPYLLPPQHRTPFLRSYCTPSRGCLLSRRGCHRSEHGTTPSSSNRALLL
jgi:hypothetical protein